MYCMLETDLMVCQCVYVRARLVVGRQMLLSHLCLHTSPWLKKQPTITAALTARRERERERDRNIVCVLEGRWVVRWMGGCAHLQCSFSLIFTLWQTGKPHWSHVCLLAHWLWSDCSAVSQHDSFICTVFPSLSLSLSCSLSHTHAHQNHAGTHRK